jgi:DNA-binding NtrC family response regulator
MAIVSTLHRYECTYRYESLPVNFGPDKGYRRNEEQCSSIKQLIDMQRLETGKVNLSEVARMLGLSRQRIHKIVNTYELAGKK